MRLRAEQRPRFYVPLVLSVALFGLYLIFYFQPLTVSGYGDIRELVFGPQQHWLLFLALAALIFFIVRLIDALVFDVVVFRRRKAPAPQLLRDLVSFALYFLLFATALSHVFAVDIRAFLTTGTVLAAVVALAMQDTLGNLFSGIALHMEESFELGDVVHSGDYIGVVEGMTWRATRIRGFNNQLVVLPNSVIARDRLEIFPVSNLNGRSLQFPVDYHVPPAKVIDILTQAASHIDGVAREIACFARVANFGDSAVVYEIKYFTRDYSQRDRIDADIRRAVWYALRRNNIAIPFPVRSFQPYTPAAAAEEISVDGIRGRLQEVDVLSPLSDEARRTIASAAVVHRYSKGETILRRGAQGDSMFVVESGTVAVRVIDPNETIGHEVAQLGPGSVFGEMALLTGEARTADVVALSDVVALEIRKDSLQPILQQHPDLVKAISSKVMQRRVDLDALQQKEAEQEELTMLSRIKSYFGLR